MAKARESKKETAQVRKEISTGGEGTGRGRARRKQGWCVGLTWDCHHLDLLAGLCGASSSRGPHRRGKGCPPASANNFIRKRPCLP